MPVQYCTDNVVRCYVFLIIIKKIVIKLKLLKGSMTWRTKMRQTKYRAFDIVSSKPARGG